jgi:hypothetical protein
MELGARRTQVSQSRGVRVSVISTTSTQPPMIADALKALKTLSQHKSLASQLRRERCKATAIAARLPAPLA